MKKGDPLPPQDSVLRACKPRTCDGGFVTSAAFELKPKDELRLSVDWVQCQFVDAHQRTLEESVGRIKKVFEISLEKSGRKLTPQKCVELQVGDIRGVKCVGVGLNVLAYGSISNECHSVIAGFVGDRTDLHIQEQLAELANSKGAKLNLA